MRSFIGQGKPRFFILNGAFFVMLFILSVCANIERIWATPTPTPYIISSPTLPQTETPTVMVSATLVPQTATSTPTPTATRTRIPTGGKGGCRNENEMAFFEILNFCLDLHEVSNLGYQQCVAAGVCSEPDQNTSHSRRKEGYYGNPDYDNHPVIRVTWDQANTYCEFVGKRLPTGEEWDIAAHAPKHYKSWPLLEEITKYNDTEAVGSIGDVSPEGVHDLAGNVREWVADDHPQLSDGKVLKGNSFYSHERDLDHGSQSDSDWGIGFRCAAGSQ